MSTTLFDREVGLLLEMGQWAEAVERAYAVGMISADDLERAFAAGTDVLAPLTGGVAT